MDRSGDSALAWLAPRTDTRPLRVLIGSEHELMTARRDGLLGPGAGVRHLAADIPESPSTRAAVIAAGVPPGGVVIAASAAWLHTGAGEIERLDVGLPHPRRDRHQGVRTRTVRLRPQEVVEIGRVRVTSRERTVSDLLRWEESPSTECAVAALVAAGVDLGAVERELRSCSLPGVARARTRVSCLRLSRRPS